ncbi:MAG: MOSC domain-containing protein [Labrys sp. (in: a-proteobacteria)]
MADGPDTATRADIIPVRKGKGTAVGTYIADGDGFVTRPVASIDLGPDGIPGDRHGGLMRPSDVRTPWHPRGTTIFNDRQLSIVAEDELATVAKRLGVPAVEPTWLGANLLLRGIRSLSTLPRGTRIFFPSGATLLVSDQNAPCRYAGASVAAQYPDQKRLDFRFVEAAARMRGVVAYVERPGLIAAGDAITIRVPEQWIW